LSWPDVPHSEAVQHRPSRSRRTGGWREARLSIARRHRLRLAANRWTTTAGGVSDVWLAGYDGINPTLALSSLSSSSVTNRYLWGPGVDFLLADEQLAPPASSASPVAAGNTLWPLGDHLGTLRDLADFGGTSFTITNHRVFDSFGRLTSETNSSVDSHFAFTGKFFDDLGDTDLSTSLSHHWNRWYDPQLGKWLSEDPIGFAGGDVNLGRYVGNEATGAVDSNGLFMDDPASGQRANDTPGYEQWVWPWDPRADWSISSTWRVWSGKAQLYGGATGQGLVTSGKAAGNTIVSTVTLGRIEQAISVTDVDLGYDGARAGFDLANLANPLDKLGKVGKVVSKVISRVGDIDSVVQGVGGIIDDGLDAGDLGSLAGAIPGPRKISSKGSNTLGVVDDVPGPKYGDIPDPRNVGAGKDFTASTKKKILEKNKERNGGIIRSDKSGTPAVPAAKSESGVTPPSNEVQIDHMIPKSKGGTNSPSNAQVLTRQENRAKSDK
jgi:RHS repeat-associated protein